jgi:prepilin-type N-terminal cleavage/methylation domain-containing protein
MKRNRAFTIVELLVALAITSLLVVLLVNVVTAALNVWQQGRNQIDTFANARQTLGRIADEIKGAVAAPNRIEFSENLLALQGNGTTNAGTSENVFFVAPYPNSGAGDLCVIAYRHNGDTHELQRAFIDSQSAWSAGSSRYQSSGYANYTWRTIATGVLEFEIQSYSQQDLDTASPAPPSWNSITGSPAEPTMLGNAPRRIVIRVKVVDDRTETKLVGLSAGNATYDRLITRAAREFTTDVVLPPLH